MSLLKRISEQNAAVAIAPKPIGGGEAAPKDKTNSKHADIKAKLHKFLVDELKKHPNMEDNKMSELIWKISEPFFETEVDRMPFEMKQLLLDTVSNELIGFGPITPLLNDPAVSEIMVNRAKSNLCGEEGASRADRCFLP